MTQKPGPTPRPRFSAIDALRGAALVGMFIYHLTWDLGFVRLISPEIAFTPVMMGLGHFVAASFLALSGASLALAWRSGFNLSHFTRRFVAIVLAATAITALTAWQFPDSIIFYGILHCIAVASLVCLALRRAPIWLIFTLAALLLILPHLISSPLFDEAQWWWLGLGTRDPPSLDWRPFVPWTGFALIGFGVMRLWLMTALPQWLTQWQAQNAFTRLLVLGGRHSLLVYLTHQPIFLVLVFMTAQLVGTPTTRALNPAQDPFFASCTNQCTVSGGNETQCRVVCGCIGEQIRKQGPMWQRLQRNDLSPADKVEIDGFTRQCLKVQP